MLEDYKHFLEVIDRDINAIFEYQKEYVRCKAGCSHCCQKGSYPITELEYKYMKLAYNKLPNELKEKIQQNFRDIKVSNEELYSCPFLIDNKCCIYSNRPIICRTFGVLMNNDKGNPIFPFCASMGLNFSQIYDKESNTLSFELLEKGNFKILPKVFNLRTTEIMNVPLAKELKLDFGEVDNMVNFFNKEIEK